MVIEAYQSTMKLHLTHHRQEMTVYEEHGSAALEHDAQSRNVISRIPHGVSAVRGLSVYLHSSAPRIWLMPKFPKVWWRSQIFSYFSAPMWSCKVIRPGKFVWRKSTIPKIIAESVIRYSSGPCTTLRRRRWNSDDDTDTKYPFTL